ncbi:MAG: hypothetical protein RIR73_1408, partial [Chloroflexota bacterium]
HAVTQVENGGLVGFYELCKRLVITLLRLENPGLFFVHVSPREGFLPSLTHSHEEKFHKFDWTIYKLRITDCEIRDA